MKKKLYKDKQTGMVSGVLSGIAQFLNVDATLVRVIFVALTLLSGNFPGVIVYVVLAFIMPDKSEIGHKDYTVE